jgi:lysophospholipase L1-like esterase
MTPVRSLAAAACTAALALTLVGAAAAPAAAQSDPGPPPDVIASMGDSITRGFNACGFYVDCTSRSFSTGDNSEVNSHYLRIRSVNPAIGGNNVNAAQSGAEAEDMPGQAQDVVASGAGYVTILIGANDACAGSEASMTPVAEYRGHIDTALATLRSGLPDARVMIISIPDLRQLWNAGRGSWLARLAWSLFGTCQSMLANPTSFADADVQRRERVRQRVIDYNTELADACAAYGPNCRFDGNAVFHYPFTLDQVSGWDYFHPNTQGQAVLASISYQAGFNW